MSWTLVGICVAVGVYFAGYLAVNAIRAGAPWYQVIAPCALLAIGIAIGVLLLRAEQLLVPQLTRQAGRWQHEIATGVAAIVAVAVCTAIAWVWRRIVPAREARIDGE